jgi:hypothetical protein
MRIRALLVALGLITFGGSSPEIREVSPIAPTTAPRAQLLTLSGQDFQPGIVLEVQTPHAGLRQIGGDAITLKSMSVVDVQILLDRAGPYGLKAINKDGGMSRPFVLTVTEGKPLPAIAIDRVDPRAPSRSDQKQTLRLEGRNLESGLSIVVTDPAGADVPGATIDKITATSAEVTVVLSTVGVYTMVVTSPTGGNSNKFTFTVR